MATLILMCGLPASGKTTVAEALRTQLEANGHTVQTICDGDDPMTTSTSLIKSEPLLSRAQLYKDASCEKQTRARLRAATDRALATKTVVLVDSLNYIKGFRYELHCLARTHAARYALILIETDAVICRTRDVSRCEQETYGSDLVDELVARFEPPSDARRWERPLHVIQGTCTSTERTQHITTICDTLRAGASLQAHKAVAAVTVAPPDGLAVLDRVTRVAEASLVTAVQTGGAGIGSVIEVPGASSKVRFGRKPRVTELRAMRRAYINLSRLHVPADADEGRLADEFVAYVNAQLQTVR